MVCEFECTLDCGRTGLAAFLEAIENFLKRTKAPNEAMTKVMIVFDEMTSNILDHGSATSISAHISVDDDSITVLLSDNGAAFDPLAVTAPNTSLSLDDRPIGGLGIHIARNLMDTIVYAREESRNWLRFAKTFAIES